MSMSQESPFSPRTQSALVSNEATKEPILRLLALLEASVKREEAARRRIDELYEQMLTLQDDHLHGRPLPSKSPSPMPTSASPSPPVTPLPPESSSPFTPPRKHASPLPPSPSPTPPSFKLSPSAQSDCSPTKADASPSSSFQAEEKYPSPSPLAPSDAVSLHAEEASLAEADASPSSSYGEEKYPHPALPSPSESSSTDVDLPVSASPTTPSPATPSISSSSAVSPSLASPSSPASAIIDAFDSSPTLTPPQDDAKAGPSTTADSPTFPPPTKAELPPPQAPTAGRWVVNSWGELAATIPHLLLHVLLLALLHCAVLLIVNERVRYLAYDAPPYHEVRDALLPRALYWSTLSALKANHMYQPALAALFLATSFLFRRLVHSLLLRHGEPSSTRRLLASSFPAHFSRFAFGVVHFTFVLLYWRVYKESSNVLELSVIFPMHAAYWGQDALAGLLLGGPLQQPLHTAASLLLFALSFAFSSLDSQLAATLGRHMMLAKPTAIAGLLLLTFLLSLLSGLRYTHMHGPFSRALRTAMQAFILFVFIPLAVVGVLLPAATSLADIYAHFLRAATPVKSHSSSPVDMPQTIKPQTTAPGREPSVAGSGARGMPEGGGGPGERRPRPAHSQGSGGAAREARAEKKARLAQARAQNTAG